ncbi:MAG: hypothetical protein A3C15_00625 [Candidatus Magasanikbacteria bacterium RIFCSPHIGHO2_02_FULL_50_9b]|uniref:DUF4238 domain-containing protein n=1 Tax=Candidatus Magasanikbacteria bacterium RIFCSPHIGHO2_02_FULL_50_9b TaxID=1798682 RepID=A0A1F6M8T2_9BACT|nr:MAG: hypothetical protein A3C15_00625 [Candidatus Magasanikbacteria bacterium RIFCSPHIGHO2_02_FULL_50_9b]
MSDEYRNHHYVPQWYQKRFLLPGEHHLFQLDMKPDTFVDPRGVSHIVEPLKWQGVRKCFTADDLYTTTIRGIETRDIEKYFFGAIDAKGGPAVEYFEQYEHPARYWGTSLQDILLYMSAQKLRTPKGLSFLGSKFGTRDKHTILRQMMRLRQLHCAIWTECVWLIADASQSDTKFIISDHPVTVYNRECGPRSWRCKEYNDPEIWLQGTHTIFPLSMNKVLILTNLSWMRNPYQCATNLRPNPNPLRNAIFNFTEVQILRHLNEQEVREINFIIKSRAHRYIAAARKEWLYPEKFISKSDWNRYGHGYLLMPDPRPINWGGEVFWGNKDGTGGAMDEYGRLPGDPDYSKETKNRTEHDTLQWFKGEFANLVGPYRRGRCMPAMSLEPERDADDFHQYHVSLQKKNSKERYQQRREK